MARSWTGVRRPVEEAVIRRERRSAPPAGWWRKWNEMDGGRWAQEKADEERKIKALLRVFSAQGEDDEKEKMQRLAEALGLIKNQNGGEY
jgi:hypothetical protein